MASTTSIADEYDRLFSQDPLLFDEDRQRIYCEKLLNNILGNRATATSRPDDLDLYDEESRAKFERPAQTRVPRPSPAARAAYQRAHLRRVGVPDKQRATLKKITMVCDGSRTKKRLDGTFAEHHRAETQLKNGRRRRKTAKSTLDRRLRIAAIGYRVRISRLYDQALLGEDLCLLTPVADAPVCPTLPERIGIRELGRTRAVKGADLARWTQTISAYIRHAHHRRSHIVVLPEFGLPAADTRVTHGLKEELWRLCDEAKGDHFLFSGSRHEGGYNRGWIFQKTGGRRKKPPKPHWHYKMASARNLGENILGPHHNRLPSTTALISLKDAPPLRLAIAVAICYDAFDPSAFLNLVQQGHKLRGEQRAGVILVPSFNPSDDFVALLRDLSFVTQSVVVYVDGLHGNAKMFICGFAVSDFAERKPFIQKEIRRYLDTYHTKQADIQEEMKTFEEQNRQYRSLKRQLGLITKRADALQELQDSLSALAISRGLDHLITVERCPDCSRKKHHQELGRCDRDILYYNLDPRFIDALRKYRQNYVNDRYLPKSLRT